MKKLIITEDGSTTLEDNRTGETYHSSFGAFAESEHIYISYGLRHFLEKTGTNACRVLEMGLGTGLNALLTYCEAERRNVKIEYHSYELYPLSEEELAQLSFPNLAYEHSEEVLRAIHKAPWGIATPLSANFTLVKHKEDFTKALFPSAIDVIFFDAFSPNVDPSLWEERIFEELYKKQTKEGLLTTYCAKGVVRRTLQSVGYAVERLEGPKGKREVLRANIP